MTQVISLENGILYICIEKRHATNGLKNKAWKIFCLIVKSLQLFLS